MTENKSKEGEETELTDEEKKAKAAAEEGLSEDELEGVSGGTGIAIAIRPVAVRQIGTAIPGISSEHIKTGNIFPKSNNILPGGSQ